MEISQIFSNGETGANRAALDWAIERGYRHGGHCSQGYMAEDGVIDERYELEEAPNNRSRNKRNARMSMGTLIVCFGEQDVDSLQTAHLAERDSRPVFVADVHKGISAKLVEQLRLWVEQVHGGLLNVIGPRESERPRIYEKTWILLDTAFGPARIRAIPRPTPKLRM